MFVLTGKTKDKKEIMLLFWMKDDHLEMEFLELEFLGSEIHNYWPWNNKQVIKWSQKTNWKKLSIHVNNCIQILPIKVWILWLHSLVFAKLFFFHTSSQPASFSFFLFFFALSEDKNPGPKKQDEPDQGKTSIVFEQVFWCLLCCQTSYFLKTRCITAHHWTKTWR